jgi:flagella basal body P-ring formation protein FlgA
MNRLSRLLLVPAALAALALGCLASTPARAGSAVTLKTSLADENGQVTLGDLFDGADSQADVVVASGKAGLGMVLDAGRVQMFARAYGLDWDNANGIRRLIVRPGAVRSERSSSSNEAGGAVTVTAPSTHAIQVLAYARDMNAGEVVGPNDLLLSRTAVPLADPPRDAQAVVGMAVRRPLREGQAVSLRDVTPAQVIKKDDVIDLIFSQDGVTLTLQGKAMENAIAGQTFNAINPESKKIIQAVAVGPGQALVGPQADQLKAAARLDPSLLASLH